MPARLIVLLGLLAVMLAGCGDLPRPFAHDGQAPDLARLPTAAGVIVVPPQNAPATFADAAAAGLAAALRATDIPAQAASETVARETGGYVIRGILSADATTLAWDLRSPEGATVLLHRQAVTPDSEPGALGTAAGTPLKAALDRDVQAPLVHRMATPGGAPEATPPPPPPPPPQVAVLSVGGLPPDRARLLRAALTGALRARGVMVTEDAALSVAGHVSLQPAEGPAGAHALRVVWTILQADGTETGNAEQANTVPAAFWAERFPALATAIADAAAGGVISVLDQTTPSPSAR